MDMRDIIGEYVYLKPVGEDLVGRCPFCFYHEPSFLVRTKFYECLHCQLKGGARDFIRRAEPIIHWEYRRSLKHVAPVHITGTVYVLALAGGRFYVGFTNDLPHRLKQHFKQQGAAYTKKHLPIKLVDIYYDVPEFVEHRVTRRYVERYGAHLVRGGWHLSAEDPEGAFFYPSRSPYRRAA
jgi:hypothetical protein